MLAHLRALGCTYPPNQLESRKPRVDNKTIVRWFEVHERKALLRANDPRAHTEFLPIDPKGRYVEKIIGRVCRVMYDVGGENGI